MFLINFIKAKERCQIVGVLFQVIRLNKLCLAFTNYLVEPSRIEPPTYALRKAGCEKIEMDKASGARVNRPGLDKLINDVLRKEDTLVVWKLHRLARSHRQLIDLVEGLQSRGVELITLQEAIDNTSPAGKLTYNIFAALAGFDRDLIKTHTQAGLEAARARGRMGGVRPQKLNSKQIELTRKLYQEKQHSIKEICELVGVSKPTLYRYLA